MIKYWGVLIGLSLVLLVYLTSPLAAAKEDHPVSSALLNQPLLLQTEPISETETLLEVAITDEGIFPPILMIPSGTTIRWTNQTSQTQRLAGTVSDFDPESVSSIQTIFLPLILKDNNNQDNHEDGGLESGEVTIDNLTANGSSTGLDTTWQSGELLPSDSFSRVFDQPGYYSYQPAGSPALSGMIIVPQPMLAAMFSSPLAVTTTSDDKTVNGNCTLREAIIAANKNIAIDACPAGSTVDKIMLGPGTYALTLQGSNENAAATGDLDIIKYSDVTIVGANDGSTIIDASQLSDRVFHILGGGKLTLSNVTLTRGSGYGGGIYNVGTLTLNNSSVLSNTASGSFGGGLKNEGTATLNNSTIAGNSADYGGGIYNRAILTLNNSTLSGNTAKKYGGGLKNEGTLKLYNITISGNTANDNGGGVLNYNYGKTYFKNTILAGNTASNSAQADCGYLSTGSQSFYSQGFNLVGTGCPSNGTGDQTTTNPQLGPLQNNGGNTFTRALLPGSPAIDAGNNSLISPDNADQDGDGNTSEPVPFDQRGLGFPRIIGGAVDIGAYEAGSTDPAQAGPIFTVNTVEAPGDGLCTVAHCSLHEAINAANTRVNGVTPDEVHFNISTGPQTISPTITLPVITDPLKIDGSTQPGFVDVPIIALDGSLAQTVFNGLDLNAGNSAVQNLVIHNFGGAGIVISGTNAISNAIRSNSIFSNTGLGIDLGGNGVTQNDLDDPDAGPNNFQNVPVIEGAVPNTDSVILEGHLNSTPGANFTLEFFANPTCDPSGFGEGQTFLGTTSITTNPNGNAVFSELSFPLANPTGQFITATATDTNGNTSEFSACIRVGEDNISWPKAKILNPGGENAPAVVEQPLDQLGQSRWYKFSVTPNSRVIVTLTNLPANYDLTIYKDIAQVFNQLNSTQDLVRLGAEFAAGARSPDEFAAGARSPDAFAAGARSPDAFAVANFSPDVFAAGARSPDVFAAGARSPDALAAGARSPDVFAPDAFAPDAVAAGARSPEDIAAGARSPEFFEAFASAQTRSLIGFSAFDGTASEGIILNTWNNTGDFYVRVRGRDSAFNPTQNFHLEVILESGSCANLNSYLSENTLTATAGGYETIILHDVSRMEGIDADKATLLDRLGQLATQVNGVVVNVGEDNRFTALNDQANNEFKSCPYAKNLAAQAIKDIIDDYRGLNPIKYIVLVGNDSVIPFFRYPDSADLGPESDFVPPVFDLTTSQASLKLNYVLSQDAYGAKIGISLNINEFPIPDLPVGRLVETPTDIIKMLEAYAQTNGLVRPNSALVTGYDFFADAAGEIETQLEAGLSAGTQADTLITPRDASPLDPRSWTADQLRSQLLNRRHDLVFLGGHFSAASALAADYQTRLVSADLATSSVLTNAIIFSIGCHSGYNIVNEHGIPQVTREPDWAQAFAQKGATLIAGTGYQYGDTDFIEYSERIYLEFARQLRTGDGPVAVGDALVKAKQKYLAETPEIRGLHEKSLLISTLFGLPMLKVDMPRKQAASGGFPTINGTVELVANNPGAALNLAVTASDIEINTNVRQSTVTLKDTNIDNPSPPINAIVLKSLNPDGVERSLTNPGEPVLPLWLGTVPGSDNRVMRGVGFRGGNYSDSTGLPPLTGAPTTEIRGVHASFFSDVFFPIQPWRVNYFDALTGVSGGATTLALMPAQYRTPVAGTNILRTFDNMQFRLYYSDNTSSSALAAAPTIAGISAIPSGDSVNFRVNVVGDPRVGIQEVWVTYTTIGGTQWQSLDLTQDTNDSTLWIGTLNLGGISPQDVRYMVQAVNGVGLVSLATNVGAYYIPGVTTGPKDPTSLSLELPGSGVYGSQASFSAVLSNNGTPLPGQPVTIGLGSQSRQAVTDGNGRATVTLPLLALPGSNEVRAAFGGTVDKAPSSATERFTIEKQSTQIALQLTNGPAASSTLVTATLQDAAGRGLAEKTVFFVVTGSGVFSTSVPVITDYAGRAPIGNLSLPPGIYNVTAYFNGEIPLSTGETVPLDDARYVPSMATGWFEVTNTPPVANNDSYYVDEDTTLNITAAGVLTNDTDIDSVLLTAVLVSNPANGTLTLNTDGSFTYIPAPNFNGADSFTYKANDGTSDSNVATVTITVNPVNDAPVAANDVYSTNEDTPLTIAAPGVLANDTDVDGNSLSSVKLSGPAGGNLTFNANGSFTYTPNSNLNGTDSFTYKVNDGSVDSNVATVTITVNAVNDAPVATGNTYSVDQNKTLTVPAPGVLSNDSDVEGNGLTAIKVSGPISGTLTLNANGSFTYAPNLNFYGTDTFTYKANDGSADSNPATVTIKVIPKTLDCSKAEPYPATLWPPNNKFRSVTVIGLADSMHHTYHGYHHDNDVRITITSIFQDEPVGKGKYSPDGKGIWTSTAQVRAERDGAGNGRVYHIGFKATDEYGFCEGKVRVAVPHDQSGPVDINVIDGGALYDSTKSSK